MDPVMQQIFGLVAHSTGDYCLQSEWMSSCKTTSWPAALAHGATYGLPFLLVTQSPTALAVIVTTHVVIDRYRLARYVCWAKNWLAPAGWNRPWRECRATGYPPDRGAPATILMVVADNTMHVAINAAALAYL